MVRWVGLLPVWRSVSGPAGSCRLHTPDRCGYGWGMAAAGPLAPSSPRNPSLHAIWFVVGASVGGGTLWSFFPGLWGFLSLLLAAAAVLVCWLAGLGGVAGDLSRRRWRRSGVRSLLLAASVPLAFLGANSGDYVHLAALYPSYWPQIAESPDGPVRFPWGDGAVSVLDGMRLRTLVYDRSGETRATVGVDQQDSTGFRIFTRHLVGNFFAEERHSH